MSKIATTWKVAPDSRALFCPHCASILQLPDAQNMTKCWECDYIIQSTPNDEANAQIQTKSYKHEVQLDDIHADPTTRRATVDEKCTNCGYHEMTFYTQQVCYHPSFLYFFLS